MDKAHVASDVLVEDGAVGDDNDRVEGGARFGIDMTDEAVAKPGNGLCFTRTRGVPNQVAPAGPLRIRMKLGLERMSRHR